MANNISKTGISKCYQDGPTTFKYNILQKHQTLMVVNEERQDEKRAHNLTFWIRISQLGSLGGLPGKCLMKNVRLASICCKNKWHNQKRPREQT